MTKLLTTQVRLLLILETVFAVVSIIGILCVLEYQSSRIEQLEHQLKVERSRKDLIITLSHLGEKTIRENPDKEIETLRWFKTMVDDSLGLTTIPE